MDSNAKVVKPRLLHGTQWGMIDPMDTPDGGNVGSTNTLLFPLVLQQEHQN